MATVVLSASQPSCITHPSHTVNIGNFGSTITIYTNRKSTDFTHTVRYVFKSQSGTIASNVGASVTWTIPLSLINLIPNAASSSGKIYVDTYKDGDLVGTKSCAFTASVPASVKPSCSIEISDPTGNKDYYGNFVKGLSRVSVVVTPTLAYGSPIRIYNSSVGGNKYTEASFTTGRFSSVGTPTISASVTDSRGRTGSTSQSITIIDYNAPKIEKLTVHRCNEDGTDNESGAYCRVTFSASVSDMDNKNSAEYKLRYKKSSVSQWIEVTLGTLTNNYSVTNESLVFAANIDSAYDVQILASDRHTSVSAKTSVSIAFILFDMHNSGTGMNFGGVAEREHFIDFSIPTGVKHPIEYSESEKVMLTLNSAFKLYDSNGVSLVWCRKNAAGMVELHGIVSPNSASNAVGGTGGETICTLPVGYRPGAMFSQLCQANGVRMWLIEVDTNGTVTASRSRTGDAYYTPSTTEKMSFHIVFFAD